MIKPGVLVAAAVLVVTIGIASIPTPKPTPDFSRPDAAPASNAREGAAPYRELRWDELMPENWDPLKAVRELQQGMRFLPDADPSAIERLKKMRGVWADAPTNRRLDGVAARIPGYIVPIEESKSGITEFLLVPYFGACNHTPPPPSNQIIHVNAQRALQQMHAMDSVWVSGTLSIERHDSTMGGSSYGMAAVAVERYVPVGKQ
jgi:hypothetical protein